MATMKMPCAVGSGSTPVEVEKLSSTITWYGSSSGLTIPTSKKARGFVARVNTYDRYAYCGEDGVMYDEGVPWVQDGVQIYATFNDNSIVVPYKYGSSDLATTVLVIY